MVRDSRRFSDESWPESLGEVNVYGYGEGPDTSVVNVEFNGDWREGGVCRDEEETCVGTHLPLPNIRLLVPQRNMSYKGSVLSTPCRQTIEGQDSESPVLTSGSRPPSVSVCNMSIFGDPPGNTGSYSTANNSAGSTSPSTNANRLGASPGGTSQVASSNMSRGASRKPGVDKADSGAINVIILRDVLQDNSMVGGFLGWGSSNS
jgi:hypothetical protein